MLSTRFFSRTGAFSGCVMWLVITSHANFAPAAEPGDPVLSALHLTMSRRIGDARKWLDERDFKSLAQTAGGLRVLGGLLKARSDDESWQTATEAVLAAIGELSAAARAEDAAQCKAALDKLEQTAAAVQARQPTGQAQQALPASGGLRPLMLVMDGIRGDGKIDLLSGNVEDAKKSAYVLSELGRVVSNSVAGRPPDPKQWQESSAAFVEASLAAARSTEADAATMRQLLRNVSQRCDACHEMR
ncbi:MAG: hypothetical protein L0211_04890 [Planctomycetaceae bacterium]|nr:hypothetical protein [Planctomycetaceae bacterium]